MLKMLLMIVLLWWAGEGQDWAALAEGRSKVAILEMISYFLFENFWQNFFKTFIEVCFVFLASVFMF